MTGFKVQGHIYYIYIYHINYININIFSKYILYVCIFIYIHNKYTRNTDIYYANKNAFDSTSIFISCKLVCFLL